MQRTTCANSGKTCARLGLDSRHTAELIRSFLAERGYGVSHDDARRAANSVEIFYGPLHRMQETLERLAVSM